MKKFAMAAFGGTLAGIVATTYVAGPLLAQEGAREATVYEQLDLFGDIFERIRAQYVEEVDEKELIEAARIDGASAIQRAFFIQIPLLWPAITISIFYSVLGGLQVFDLVMPMTAGGPSNSSHTLVSYLYNFGFVRLNVGFGSAVTFRQRFAAQVGTSPTTYRASFRSMTP